MFPSTLRWKTCISKWSDQFIKRRQEQNRQNQDQHTRCETSAFMLVSLRVFLFQATSQQRQWNIHFSYQFILSAVSFEPRYVAIHPLLVSLKLYLVPLFSIWFSRCTWGCCWFLKPNVWNFYTLWLKSIVIGGGSLFKWWFTAHLKVGDYLKSHSDKCRVNKGRLTLFCCFCCITVAMVQQRRPQARRTHGWQQLGRCMSFCGECCPDDRLTRTFLLL